MANIYPMQAIQDDDEFQAQVRYSMRLWALNMAAGRTTTSPCIRRMDCSPPAIAEHGEQQ